MKHTCEVQWIEKCAHREIFLYMNRNIKVQLSVLFYIINLYFHHFGFVLLEHFLQLLKHYTILSDFFCFVFFVEHIFMETATACLES